MVASLDSVSAECITCRLINRLRSVKFAKEAPGLKNLTL